MENIIFIATGDWGMLSPTFYSSLSSVAKHKLDTSFFILLGDNFYPGGVSTTNDPQWEKLYKVAFPTEIPSFAVLGNHDYILNPKAQIDYSSLQPSWKMPFYYYDMITHLSSNLTVHFIFIDTCLLAEDITIPLLRNTDVRALSQYQILLRAYKKKQEDWLKEVLRTSTAKWKIVCGHYPVFSNGPHTISRSLQEFLAPLFRQYSVDFYLSGHDHNLQHMIKNNTNYIVAGAFCSSHMHNGISYEHINSRFQSSSSGYARFEITSNIVKLQFFSSDHRVLYYYSCSKL
jgi:3',5'-cyclic AMP phosphodiesterase CpdA